VAEVICFYFDQHMPGIAVSALRRRGVDVLTAHEAGTCGTSDEDQLRYATAHGRAVVTFDADYLVLADAFLASGETFAGVVYCRPDRYSQNPTRLAAELLIVHGAMTPDEMVNHVEYL
jgi:predicted nuclease of predicted toxin-antitoxin system